MPLQRREANIETSVDNRRRRRHKLLLEVEAQGPEAVPATVFVHDISDTGLLIETQSELGVGEMVAVNLPHAGMMEAEIMWAGGQVYGCRFTEELTPATISAARLGGRYTLTDADAVAAEPKGGIMDQDALAERFSLGGKLWIIIALATSLWIVIGAAAFWLL